MAVTTLLREDGAVAPVSAGNDNGGMFAHRFSWSAAFAGAFVATAVTFLLLALGTGFGLSLVSAQTPATPTFLTLGAIYFLSAQAFGFAAGGHLAGRLIGPASETAKEEEFRSAAHGLVVWALAVVATATLIAVGSIAAGGSAIAVAATSAKWDGAQSAQMTPPYIGYWVDLLFRPGPGPSQAALIWPRYAQADTGTATDAEPPTAPAPQMMPSTDTNEPAGPPRQLGAPTPNTTAATPPAAGVMQSGIPSAASPASTALPSGPREQEIQPAAPMGFTPPPSLSADKTEAGRIIEVGMASGQRLDAYDTARIAALVAQDTGLSVPDALRRVDNAETRIHADAVQSAETARKIASHASLWIAFSLLFGAIVSAMAAVSARWEDDRVSFGWRRREPE